MKLGFLIGYLCLPSFVVLSWHGYQEYAQAFNTPRSIVKPQTVPVQVLAYPDLGELEPWTAAQVPSVEKQKGSSESKLKEESSSSLPDFSDVDLTQLSPQLAERLQQVMAESEPEKTENTASQAIALLTHAQQFKGRLPSMNFQTHVYVSQANKRWIKMNGNEYQEGDWLLENIQLLAIYPQSVWIRFNEETIEIPALYEWRSE